MTAAKKPAAKKPATPKKKGPGRPKGAVNKTDNPVTLQVGDSEESSNRGRKPIKFDVAGFRGLGELDCTYAEMAAFFRCSERTILKRMNDTPALAEAYNEGKASGTVSLRRAQFRAAIRGSVPMLKHLGEHRLGQKVTVENINREGPPINARLRIWAEEDAENDNNAPLPAIANDPPAQPNTFKRTLEERLKQNGTK